MHNIETFKKTPALLAPPPGSPLVWLDGSDRSSMTIAGTISQWRDKSGNGFHANQGSAGLQPGLVTSQSNGRSAVSFGGSQSMVVSSLPLGAFCIFAVWRATVDGLVFEHSVNANINPGGAYMYPSTSQTILVNRGGTLSDKNISTDWGLGNVWRATSHRFNGTNVTNLIGVNGVDQGVNGPDTGDPGTSVVTADWYIASRAASSVFLTGDIAEIVIYNTFLSTALVATINTYLNNKWRIY